MGENTLIEWTDHTFNPWIGCTKVSAGCANCYAETHDKRWGKDRWGAGKLRERTSEKNWTQPIRWNTAAAKAARRARVFCASFADVFDEEVPQSWRDDLFKLISITQCLDWQLLTKRPENIIRLTPRWFDFSKQRNVWLGTTVENQNAADRRIPILLQTPVAVRFLSMEPLLEHMNLWRWLNAWSAVGQERALFAVGRLHWVIVGGESGGKARPFNLEWARSIVDQCRAAKVPCFVKQMGARPFDGVPRARFSDRKGGNWDEWPADLRVREFPNGVAL